MKIYFAALTFIMSSLVFDASAQLNFDYTEGKILLKGSVLDMQSKVLLPNASIVIQNRKKGQSADADGKFQIYVYPSDTLRFSSLGYIWKEIPVSGIPESMRYSLEILLMKDFYKLREVTIYPFSNKREFEEAFVRGEGIAHNVLVPGIEAPKYIHKEKAKFYNPISSIYERVKKKRAGNPDFKP